MTPQDASAAAHGTAFQDSMQSVLMWCSWSMSQPVTGDSVRGGDAPEVGSSMKTMEGLPTSSTAMVSRFLCSTDKPLWPGRPITAPACDSNSTRPSTCQVATQTQCARDAPQAASDNTYYDVRCVRSAASRNGCVPSLSHSSQSWKVQESCNDAV